jgi:hypothetical protein
MHFVSKPTALDGDEARPDTESAESPGDARDRQAAAWYLQLAAIAEDAEIRRALRRRAAKLLLPHRARIS